MTLSKNDIRDRNDIELLVNNFYEQIKKDPSIGFIFNDIIGDDWSHHLPIMYNFWETVLFGKGGYQGNPIKKHIDIDKKTELKKEHYERWLSLWQQTVDDTFYGDVASNAKE